MYFSESYWFSYFQKVTEALFGVPGALIKPLEAQFMDCSAVAGIVSKTQRHL